MYFSNLWNPVAQYSRLESWFYDTIIAPSLRQFDGEIGQRLLPEIPSGGRLLEVGCGGGQLLATLASAREDLELCGIDLSPQQIGRARARTGSFGDRVRCAEGSALELPFANGGFDAVVSVGSIKHWPEPARGLAECARVLRSGGVLAVVEADRGCRSDDVARFVEGWRVPGLAKPVARVFFRTLVAGRSLDLDDARALLAGLPLAPASVERVPGAPGWLLWARRA